LIFFSGTTAYKVTRLARNVPLAVLKKCCYFSEGLKESKMASLASDWLRHFNFSTTTACEITRLAKNVPVAVLKECCYFSE